MSNIDRHIKEKCTQQRVKPWSVLFLTSCLTTGADQVPVSTEIHTAADAPTSSHSPSSVRYAALTRSIESVVNEFFSFKDLLVAPVYAAGTGGTSTNPGGTGEHGEGGPTNTGTLIDPSANGGGPITPAPDGGPNPGPAPAPAPSPGTNTGGGGNPAPGGDGGLEGGGANGGGWHGGDPWDGTGTTGGGDEPGGGDPGGGDPGLSSSSEGSPHSKSPCPPLNSSFESSSSATGGGGIAWPLTPREKALPTDMRYRDLCISGAPLKTADFNSDTGVTTALDISISGPGPSPTPLPNTPTQFDEKYTGNVSGAKPPVKPSNGGEAYCMPMRDTPKIAVDYNSFSPLSKRNSAFSHYLNMDDEQFAIPSSGIPDKTDVYNNSNDYRRKTFFIGGPDTKLNCPDIVALAPGPQPVATLAEFQRIKAENCYNYYILNHSAAPWYVLERPGPSTDDPLSHFDPERSFLNNCQPLVNGTSAKQITEKKWQESISNPPPNVITADTLEKKSGYAPVYQYLHDPSRDEAEYLLSTKLKSAWKKDFESNLPPNPNVPTHYTKHIHKHFSEISLPCIQRMSDAGFPTIPPPNRFPPPDTTTTSSDVGPTTPGGGGPNTGGGEQGPITPGPGYSSTFDSSSSSCPSEGSGGTGPGPSPSPSPACEPPVFPVTFITYTSPGTTNYTHYYCPNVEKIVDPSHPFSPRNDMVINDIPGSNPSYFDQFYPNSSQGYLTDRDYSWKTSICVPKCKNNPTQDLKRGYTNYVPKDCKTGAIIPSKYSKPSAPGSTTLTINKDEQIRNPIVQCAIVPVDILSFRREQFESCIMQRINHNFNKWLEDGRPDPETWKPPCKTRFFETDTPAQCPVQMSIQQCCHIAIKDIAPANNLRYRTCEGLMQNRLDTDPLKQKYGIENVTHITDERFSEAPARVDCPPDFPDCYPIISAYTGQNVDIFDGEGYAYNYARKLTEALNGNTNLTEGYTCGRRAQTGALLIPTEPDEYMFSHYFKEFIYPELDTDTPDPYDKKDLFLGYHMPYMKRLDTGVSSGNPYRGGSFLNVLGSFDVWTGIGREERNARDAELAKKAVENWGNSHGGDPTDAGGSIKDRVSKYEPSEIGRIGGWAEAKAHQMWTIRRSNLTCIGRYEKLFKPGGQEQLVLSKAGSGYTTRDYNQFPWSLGWRGYVTDDHDSGQFSYSHMPTSNGLWSFNFPNFPQGEGSPNAAKITSQSDGNGGVFYGLDNALPGDIILYKMNGTHYLSYVTDINFDVEGFKNAKFVPEISKYTLDGKTLTPSSVVVVGWDQGKFPTATGSTLNWGMGLQRTIYKEKVPENYRKEICSHKIRALVDSDPNSTSCQDPAITASVCNNPNSGSPGNKNTCQPSCQDPDYVNCVLPKAKNDWEKAVIYRAEKDKRPCIGYGQLTGPVSGLPTTLSATYAWTGNLINGKLPPVDPGVIYQTDTIKVHANIWAFCANAGWDPPPFWNHEYSGAQTGAITDATLCGPKWGTPNNTIDAQTGCAAAPKAKIYLSPEGSSTGGGAGTTR